MTLANNQRSDVMGIRILSIYPPEVWPILTTVSVSAACPSNAVSRRSGRDENSNVARDAGVVRSVGGASRKRAA